MYGEKVQDSGYTVSHGPQCVPAWGGGCSQRISKCEPRRLDPSYTSRFPYLFSLEIQTEGITIMFSSTIRLIQLESQPFYY